jgi:hypothetical protein
MRGVLRLVRLPDGRWVVQLVGRQHRVLEQSPAGTETEAKHYLANYQRFLCWRQS